MSSPRDIIDEVIDNNGMACLLEMVAESCNERRTAAGDNGDDELAEGWRQMGKKLGELIRSINTPERAPEPPRPAPPPEAKINYNDFPRRTKGRKSRKALFADLQLMVAKGIGVEVPDNYKKISNEVYGKDAQCYVQFESNLERRRGEKALEWMGHIVNRSYSPGSSIAEIGVTYFKGWHWDE
jgi:hypothetical protein